MKKPSERHDSMVLISRLFMLVVFAAMFAGEAQAAGNRVREPDRYEKNPNWVGRTWAASIVRNPRQNDEKKPDYWQVHIVFTHTNNSKDRDIVTLYERTMEFSATLAVRLAGVRQRTAVRRRDSYSENINVELWPGKKYGRTWTINMGALISPNEWEWGTINRRIAEFNGNAGRMFDDMRVTYTVHVRSRKSR